jgi:hypothetical protein
VSEEEVVGVAVQEGHEVLDLAGAPLISTL